MSVVLGACTTAADRAGEMEAVNKQAVQEVRRICALPEPQRQAEIERVKKEFDITVYCPKQ